MDKKTTHQKVVKNASKIVDFADSKGINAAARKYNISSWSVYVAKALEGEKVPAGTLALIRERIPSLRKSKKR